MAGPGETCQCGHEWDQHPFVADHFNPCRACTCLGFKPNPNPKQWAKVGQHGEGA